MKKNYEHFRAFMRNRIKIYRVMKISLVFIILSMMQVSATVYSQNGNITVNVSEIELSDLFWELQESAGIVFIYKSKDLAGFNKVNLNKKNTSIEVILDEVLKGKGLDYSIDDNVVIVKKVAVKSEMATSKERQQEKKKQRGIVRDVDGNPIPGVSVIVKGTRDGTATDQDGKYIIEIKDEASILVFSFIGMISQEVSCLGEAVQNITLVSDVEQVEEVVVTGYFTARKDSYTGAATTFSGEDLKSVSTQNVLSTLSVLDPSFKMVENIDAGSDPNYIPEFQIHGQSSLEGDYRNAPNMPTFILDGFETSSQKIFDLDPNRVKSITILKDAVATAIYGSRAANGVVVVETLAPEPGNLKVSYSLASDLSVADLSDYNIMNSTEKLEYERLAGLYSSDNIYYQDNKLDEYNEKLALVKKGVNTDWMALPLKQASLSHKHSLYIEGGDNKFRYGVDFSYGNRAGVMKGSSNNIVGTGVKLQYRYKNINFKNHISYDNVIQKNSPYGNFAQYTYMNPYYYPYNENGSVKKLIYDFETPGTSNVYNPLYNTTLLTKDELRYTNFINNFSIEWKILTGLTLKSNLSIEQKKVQKDIFKPAGHTSFVNKTVKGSYYKSVEDQFTYDANAMLTYLKVIDKHVLNTSFVYNVRESNDDGFSFTAVNFPNDNMNHVGMGIEFAEGDKPEGYNYVNRLLGFVANFNYSYDNKYLLDFSMRSDASSVYGADRRWGTFGAVGLGWNIHNEELFKNLDVLNTLKLRASVGTTGSNNFNPYQAMMTYSYRDNSIYGMSYDGYIGALLKAYGNTNLKWQKTEKINVGIDFGFLNNRITGRANMYKDMSKGVLIDVLLAPSTGFNSFKDNLGIVQNSGFDFNIKGSLINNHEKKIQVDLFLNMTRNVNKLLEINDALAAYNEVQDNATNENSNQKPIVRFRENESINTIWANQSLGIDPNTGEEVFVDLNGAKTNVWSTENYKPLGCKDPKVEGNFGTMVMYKNFQLNAYFRYSYGGDIYNNTLVSKVENVNPLDNADRRVLYDRWKKPGDIAKYKAISNTSSTMPTSRFIEVENYISLSSINLSYRFDYHSLKKYGVSNLKVALIGNDIFRKSTIKAERGINYPFARNYSLSLQLTF